MPSSTYLVGIGEFQWCPYSDESILVTLSTSTDTNGSGNLIYGESLYLLDIKNGSITRTMPALMSICGATDMQLLSWLPTSSASNDTILIRYRLKAFGGDPFAHKKYHVQSDRIEPVDNLNCLAGLCCFDKMSKMFAHIKTASVAEDYRLYIGSELVQLPHFESIQYLRISRDGKYIALDVLPPHTDSIRGLSSEIWLINTNKWLANKADTSYLSVINLQNINCSYSFGGAYPEFLTDSTLALNLHKDGDATSPPYEVTFGGKLVRRISVIR